MSLTVIKPLPSPWSLAGQKANDIEVRPPLLEDLMDAEKEAHPNLAPIAYRVALACRQIVRAGNYTGPFTAAHFKKMKPSAWTAVIEALDEAEQLGEDEQPERGPTS